MNIIIQDNTYYKNMKLILDYRLNFDSNPIQIEFESRKFNPSPT